MTCYHGRARFDCIECAVEVSAEWMRRYEKQWLAYVQAAAVCRYLRGEVERLEAELALMQIQRDARPKIPIVINSACKHRNMWGDVYDNKRTYRCPDCGLEYEEVTHE